MEQFNQLLRDSGIVGAGGAGFPSYAKLLEGANLLIVNGAECEPLLYTDYSIMESKLTRIIFGTEKILDAGNIPKALLAIKRHTATRLSLSDGEKLSDRISVKVLDDIYPVGDEIALIYEASGRLVKPGKLPITEKVMVFNVETVYNISKAVSGGYPVVSKWVTIGGDIEKPIVVRVPVGSLVKDIFDALGITVKENQTVIDGGPSMGRIINPRVTNIKKNTKALLILPSDIQAVISKTKNVKMSIARAATACCQCTRCTDMCPRALLGYPLEPHKMVRTAMQIAEASPKMVISASLCSACGVCETLACPQGISPRLVISNYKTVLAKNKMRYTADTAEVPPEREYRKISSERWKRALGVSEFDAVPTRVLRMYFDKVELSLSQHIGAPSIPVVKTGDIVKRGQLIAEGADGLSVSLHASIDGVVTVFENDKIRIEKVD